MRVDVGIVCSIVGLGLCDLCARNPARREYSSENWPLFRYYATCILVVMFIIEAVERRLDEPLRHQPLAATRLFQLIAHLVELPTIPAIKRAYEEKLDHLPAEYLPTSDELVAYRAEVVAPVMAASQIIAEACGIAGGRY